MMKRKGKILQARGGEAAPFRHNSNDTYVNSEPMVSHKACTVSNQTKSEYKGIDKNSHL